MSSVELGIVKKPPNLTPQSRLRRASSPFKGARRIQIASPERGGEPRSGGGVVRKMPPELTRKGVCICLIRITNVKLPLDYTSETLYAAAAKVLRIKASDIKAVTLHKLSIDARHKENIIFTAALDAELFSDEEKTVNRCASASIGIAKDFIYTVPKHGKLDKRPVVVGAGPAGLFAALVLARAQQCPILLERGAPVEERTADVERFRLEGVLNTESNVQFGEGGAGTFSDGKLNTGTKDVRSRFVLRELAAHGAPKEILINAKPHVGTDKLKQTVVNIRREIISLGGDVRFHTKLTDIKHSGGKVVSVLAKTPDGTVEEIFTDHVILALGHSARDTFEMLCRSGFVMEQKPFSVGVRIEHLQESINKAQYGRFYRNERLGAADYKLSTHLKNGRSVYTFCMCPGGEVMAAASEAGTVVTNGMSEFARSAVNANSALLVGVTPDDFMSDDPLEGVEFQRRIEKAAFSAGGGNYCAPIQRVEDFLCGRKTTDLGEVVPSYKPGGSFARLEEYLPEYVTESIHAALPIFDGKLRGFAHPDAVLTGAETRSSSPVRILRLGTLQSVAVSGVYPCGEGAGYAGGIVSAAVDGVRCAEMVLLGTFGG